MCVGWGSMAKQLFSPESPTPARLTRMCQTHLCQTRFCDLLSPQTSVDTHWWICCILIPAVISIQDLCIFTEIIDILFSQFFKDIEECISVLKKKSLLTNQAPMWPCITAPSIRVITHISDSYLPLLVLPTLATCYLSQSHPVLASLLHQSC